MTAQTVTPAPAPDRTGPRGRPRPRTGPAHGCRSAPPRRADQRRPPRPARPVTLPPHVWFADRLLSVLTGHRPISSLAGRVRDPAYGRLWDLMNARVDWQRHSRGHEPCVLSCRVSRAQDDALEVTAVVGLRRDTVRAIAFRLERGRDGDRAWRCTAVEAR